RGFETVTYMIDGRFAHQDSHGGGGLITDGATQWMTAGSGILHIETPPAELVESGGAFHGIQLWVNLPRSAKFSQPKYQAIEGDHVALVASEDGGALVRIIAGEVGEYRGPGSTYTPITLAHATIEPGAQLNLPWRSDFNALVYVLSGRGTVGPATQPVEQGQLAVLGSGDRITVVADASQDSNRPAMEVLLLGGKPIREPVFAYGPFVMNTKSEIIRALEDYEAGRFGRIPPNALMPHRVNSERAVAARKAGSRTVRRRARRGVGLRSTPAWRCPWAGCTPRSRSTGRWSSRRTHGLPLVAQDLVASPVDFLLRGVHVGIESAPRPDGRLGAVRKGQPVVDQLIDAPSGDPGRHDRTMTKKQSS